MMQNETHSDEFAGTPYQMMHARCEACETARMRAISDAYQPGDSGQFDCHLCDEATEHTILREA